MSIQLSNEEHNNCAEDENTIILNENGLDEEEFSVISNLLNISDYKKQVFIYTRQNSYLYHISI